MAILLKEIKKLGWKAVISNQTNGNWIGFSDENETIFSNCNVVINEAKTELIVTPNSESVISVINIGDIRFDYNSNKDSNSERRATVTLTQDDTEETHVYTLIQMKDEMSLVYYDDFKCEYTYHFESTPDTKRQLKNLFADNLANGWENFEGNVTGITYAPSQFRIDDIEGDLYSPVIILEPNTTYCFSCYGSDPIGHSAGSNSAYAICPASESHKYNSDVYSYGSVFNPIWNEERDGRYWFSFTTPSSKVKFVYNLFVNGTSRFNPQRIIKPQFEIGNRPTEFTSSSSPISTAMIDGQHGGTIVVTSNVETIEITYSFTKQYKSGNIEQFKFRFRENEYGVRTLESGLTLNPDEWYEITGETSGYLENVTRVFKSQNAEGFFGFSRASYAKESTYSLTQLLKGNVNLFKGYFSSGWQNWGCATTGITYTPSRFRIDDVYGDLYSPVVILEANTTYCFSCYGTDPRNNNSAYAICPTSTPHTCSSDIYDIGRVSPEWNVENDGRYWFTFTTPSEPQKFIYDLFNSNNQYISKPQLEIGDKPTAFDSGSTNLSELTNIISEPNKGPSCTINVGRNPDDYLDRYFGLICEPFRNNNVAATTTVDDEPNITTFIYGQKSGYTEDNRGFILTYNCNSLSKSLTEYTNLVITVNFTDNDNSTWYLTKNSSGKTVVSSSYVNIPLSEWEELISEGTRPYPEFGDEDTLIRKKDTGALYPTSYSGDVCTKYVSKWMPACPTDYTVGDCVTFKKAYKGQQEDCDDVKDKIFKKGQMGNPPSNPKDGDCACLDHNYRWGTGDTYYNRDLTYHFGASKTAGSYDSRITVSLNSSSTGKTQVVYIDSKSTCEEKSDEYSTYFCSGTVQTFNVDLGGWFYYDEMHSEGSCVGNDCPCEVVDNKVTGTTYDYSIRFEFEYDYKKIRNKKIICNIRSDYSNIASGYVTVNNNTTSQIIRMDGNLTNS